MVNDMNLSNIVGRCPTDCVFCWCFLIPSMVTWQPSSQAQLHVAGCKGLRVLMEQWSCHAWKSAGEHHREDQRSLQILAVTNWLKNVEDVQAEVDFYDFRLIRLISIARDLWMSLGWPLWRFHEISKMSTRRLGEARRFHQQTIFQTAGC